jgi:hypothetical protein
MVKMISSDMVGSVAVSGKWASGGWWLVTGDYLQLATCLLATKLLPMNQLRWLQVGGVVMGVTAVCLIALIASGMFDPKAIGEPVQTWENKRVTAVAHQQNITWLPGQLPPGNFSLRATLAQQSGEPDSGAGMLLANDCANIIIALSPLGYATIQQQPLITGFPWQPWPHVRTGSQPNEIWVDVEDGQMEVRINRELLWAGESPFIPERVGIYGESWGMDAVYNFQQIQLFSE